MRFSRLPEALVGRFGATASAVPDRRGANAAVALVLRPPPEPPDPLVRASDVLVIRRAESARDPWSGQMALPGGRLDPSDPDLVAAAVRETREETALELDPGGVTGRIREIRSLGASLPAITVWPFVFRAGAGAGARVASPEVATVHWLPVEALAARESQDVFRYEVDGSVRRFPCIRVEGQVVWGLTYRILRCFLGSL